MSNIQQNLSHCERLMATNRRCLLVFRPLSSSLPAWVTWLVLANEIAYVERNLKDKIPSWTFWLQASQHSYTRKLNYTTWRRTTRLSTTNQQNWKREILWFQATWLWSRLLGRENWNVYLPHTDFSQDIMPRLQPLARG